MTIRTTGARFALAALCAAPLLAGCEKRSPEEALWRKHCADCHGLDASGNTPRYMGNQWANLIDNAWKNSGSDEYSISAVIREGVFGQMPGNSSLSDAEVRQIVAWLRHLRGDALCRFQDRCARAAAAYAAARAPFYRAHFAGHDLAAWRTLPTVDKARMMANFDTFNTCGMTLAEALDAALRAERCRDFSPQVRGLTVGLSSGTSGHRGLFLVSRAEQAAWAGTILARALPA